MTAPVPVPDLTVTSTAESGDAGNFGDTFMTSPFDVNFGNQGDWKDKFALMVALGIIVYVWKGK